MKWSVVGLVMMGVVAAVCVTVLVGAMQAGAREGDSAARVPAPEVSILVAAEDLSASTIVEGGAVATKTVLQAEAPQGCLTDAVQAVGKVLELPMVKGQVFKNSCFAKEGTGLHLASALPNGMRVVGVSLSDSSGLHGLLYPGSIVDVLASSKARAGQRPGVETLLTGIRVLGIEDHTIVSSQDQDGKLAGRLGRGQREMVTLMVDPQQAELLQVALERGGISLALRHPLDLAPAHREVKPAAKEEIAPARPRPSTQVWQITVLSGTQREVVEFPYPAGKALR